MRKALVLVLTLALGVAAVAATAQARSQASRSMYGISIIDYKVTKTHTVTIRVRIRGLMMGAMSRKNVAGKGHWNIYVDGRLNNYSANATTGTTKALKKGDYKVYVALVDNDGTPLSEPTRSKTVTVMVD